MLNKPFQHVASLMGASSNYSALVSGVCVDSRLAIAGNLFFALKGDRTDGHQFLQEISSKKCCGAVVDKQYSGPDFGLCLIKVDDVLLALQNLARNTILERNVKIVAVTGSVGKTTTKDFIASLLKQKYNVSASPGNSNSQIGIPIAILNHTDGKEDILVLEMGMTASGHIAKLASIAPPDVSVITTTALVHACNFNSLADIGRAKAEIFTHPKTQIGIYHYDIENGEEIKQIGSCKKFSFSLDVKEADYFLEPISEKIKISTSHGEEILLGPFSVLGRHNLQNLLAAITCTRSLGLEWEYIQKGLPELVLPERRLQMIERRGIAFINDSYNASAISVKAALRSLPDPLNNGRRIAVLGDMMELGKFSKQCHQEVGEEALQFVDTMLCLGKECQVIYECWQKAGRPVKWFMDRSELVNELKKYLQPGDVVLLKASRSIQLWKVLEELGL